MHTTKQRLFLIGGKADAVLTDFVALAGGLSAQVVIITHASGVPRQSANNVVAQFKALGVSRITVLMPRDNTLPADADAIYMTGGDQLRLVRRLDGSGLGEQIREATRRGVVAGSSAGAAAASYVMIAGGMADLVLRRDSLVLSKGLCLLRGVVMDTHFGNRGREPRLRAAVASVPGHIGIGLDEDTAIDVHQGLCRVHGNGYVWVFRPPLCPADTWEEIAQGARLEKFAAGERFRLAE